MNSNVEITLVSDDGALQSQIKGLRILGATISYGINRLPVAHVHVDPTGLKTFCNFDYYRRRRVVLTILTGGGGLDVSSGCISFTGMIDGISISQQPGALLTSLVIKHEFTLLNEVYPRILGISPGTANMFAVQRPTTYDPNSYGNTSAQNNFLSADLPLLGYISGQKSINSKQALIPFIVEVCRAVVKYQLLSGIPQVGDKFLAISNALSDVIKAQQVNAKDIEPKVTQLLQNINTSFADNFELKASDVLLSAGSPTLAFKVTEMVGNLDDTVYNTMVRLVGQYGCVFVVANNTAFIIPETPYLKVQIVNTSSFKGRSLQTNVAFPADYESFNFNDNGENTIKGVYIVPDVVGMQGSWVVGGTNVLNGRYIDDSDSSGRTVFGNIVIKTLPQFAASYVSHIAGQGSLGIQNSIKAGLPLIGAGVDMKAFNASILKHKTAANTQIGKIQKFLDAWAQLEYCRLKYEDRTGQISMPFRNNWVPGAPGSVYTNHPGMYVDFFVTDVTHNFSMHPNNSGNASTTVSFKGGRPGGVATRTGLDNIALYNYDYDKSQQFCKAFLADTKP